MAKELHNEKKEISFSNAQLRSLVVPLMIEQLLSISVGLIDSMMVASVGDAAVSAVSLVDSVSNLMINLFAALATGGAVVAGQYIGRQEANRARDGGRQLILLLFWFSLAVTAFMYASKGFWLNVIFGGVAPDVAAATNTYYSIVMASIPFIALYNGCAALFRTMKKSKVTMRVSLLMNVFNAVGNGILIFGFGMGVEGVAIPTLASRMLAAAVMLALLWNPEESLHLRGLGKTRFEGSLVRSILAVGIPGGVENTMFHFGRLIITSLVASMSTSAIVANAIGNTVGVFHIFAAQSMGLGMVTVCSQCVGAGDYQKVRLYTNKLMKSMIYAQLAINLVLAAATPLILKLYNVTEEASQLALIVILLHGAFSILFYPLGFGFCNTLRAAGDAKYVMQVSTITMWVGRIFGGWLLGNVLGMGVIGVWIAQAVLDWCPRSLIFVMRYRGNAWEKKKLAE